MGRKRKGIKKGQLTAGKEYKTSIPLNVLKGIEKSKLSKTPDLTKIKSRMGANTSLQRMLMSQLSNLNAIPDSPSMPTPTGGGGGSPETPATTPAVEIVTQAGAVLQTQDSYDLTTQ